MPAASIEVVRRTGAFCRLHLIRVMVVLGACAAARAVESTTTTVSSSLNPSLVSQGVHFTATVTGSISGNLGSAGTVQFKIDGAAFGGPVNLSNSSATSQTTSTLSAGTHTVTADYSGYAAGEFSYLGSTGTLTGGQVVNSGTASTSTSVSSSVNPSVYGQNVLFTATVSSASGTPSGTVQFVMDGANFGSPVTLSSGSASAQTAGLAVGTHTIFASYTPTGNFGASSGSLAGGQTINKASTSTTVSSSANPSLQSQGVTFTATVTALTPGSGIPQGTVQFRIDGADFGGTPGLNGSSQASVFSTSLSAGAHTVTASYNGNASYNPSNGALPGGQFVCAGSGISIDQQPQSLQVCPGASASFSVGASGCALTYQWQKNGTNLSNGGHYSGVTTTTLSISQTDSSDAATYRCVATNALGNPLASNGALLVVQCPGSITITQQPSSRSECPGATTTFQVSATGTGTLTYHWRKDGNFLNDGGHYSGALTQYLTITSVDASDVAGYDCVITDSSSSANSASASLSLLSGNAPTITSGPAPQSACQGDTVTFQVTDSQSGVGVSYQWYKDGAPLSDDGHFAFTHLAALQISPVGAGDAGGYACRVTNTCSGASTLSGSAALTVNACTSPFDLNWYTIDCGGGTSSNLVPIGQATWELSGTIGQPDATGSAALTGSGWSLTGGFWAATGTLTCTTFVAADFDHDCDVDADDVNAFKSCASRSGVSLLPQCQNRDFDHDNDVDMDDFAIIQRCYSGANEPANPNCAM